MELVRDYEEFIQRLSEFKKGHKPICSNFFLFGEKLRHIVDQKRLYFEVAENCFLIFLDEGNFFQFYFCANQDGKIPHIARRKTISSFLVYRMNGKNLDMDQQEKLLRHAGFCRKGDSIQFSANLEEIREYQEEKYALLEAQLKSSEFEVGFLAEKDYDELEKLWKESFEIYRVPGLKNEWTEIVKDRRIMIIQDVRKRKMVASFFRTFENKSVHISKVCVHKEYQGKSLGKWILLAGLMDAVRSGAKRCITEIDEGNNPSIHAHRFAIPNMQRTGIVAQQFICESEESL